nr:2-amino-4-hydroxy-6-hydroxymethyldihydropteridine diphosphokinase [Ideonella benzenivorans]
MGPSVQACIGLGANLGDPAQTLRQALAALDTLPGSRLLAQSSLYRTAPVEASGPDYVNAVAVLETGLGAEQLLRQLQRLEQAAGRERPYRNAPRTLDLDLLLYGDRVQDDPVLTLPHPRMHLRAFVLVPLAEVRPDLVLPSHGALHVLIHGLQGQPIQKIAP